MTKHLHDYCLVDNQENSAHCYSEQQPEDWVQLEAAMKAVLSENLLKAPASVLTRLANLENPCGRNSEPDKGC